MRMKTGLNSSGRVRKNARPPVASEKDSKERMIPDGVKAGIRLYFFKTCSLKGILYPTV